MGSWLFRFLVCCWACVWIGVVKSLGVLVLARRAGVEEPVRNLLLFEAPRLNVAVEERQVHKPTVTPFIRVHHPRPGRTGLGWRVGVTILVESSCRGAVNIHTRVIIHLPYFGFVLVDLGYIYHFDLARYAAELVIVLYFLVGLPIADVRRHVQSVDDVVKRLDIVRRPLESRALEELVACKIPIQAGRQIGSAEGSELLSPNIWRQQIRPNHALRDVVAGALLLWSLA